MKDSKNILILASGKQFVTNYVSVIPEPERCYVRLSGYTIPEIAAAFSDPFETTQMIYGNTLITGFTTFLNIKNEESTGTVRVTLKK